MLANDTVNNAGLLRAGEAFHELLDTVKVRILSK
jgi:hypothetical protein